MMDDPIQQIHWALEVLGLPPMSTYQDLKHRYRQLADRYHPDRGGSEEEMAKINEAYEILAGYMRNYRFSFSDQEILRQFPHEAHMKRFQF
ncbi:MAG: molecular chaperone DnaJ [Nitratiruptor sp.]|nr:molecular chaperone DnaJ [Nitratiruptor sp.]NPA83401.1 J domain-containing protein [Campylobacterota bacterium]